MIKRICRGAAVVLPACTLAVSPAFAQEAASWDP